MSALVAVLTAAAVLLLLPAAARPGRAEVAPSAVTGAETALLRRARGVLVALTVVGAWTFLGGWVGLGAGLGAGVVAWRVLGAVESPAAARRRTALARDLPMAVHLFGASLRAGAAVEPALNAVAAAVQGPVAEELLLLGRRLACGVDPEVAWSAVPEELRPWGRSMVRAHRTGASVLASVDRLAEELRAVRSYRTAALARQVGVRAAAPLGLCFLPAFVVLGVVPMVVGIFSTMSLFR